MRAGLSHIEYEDWVYWLHNERLMVAEAAADGKERIQIWKK